MKQSIVFVAGSPSDSSRSAFVAHIVASETQQAGWHPVFFSLRNFDPASVLFGRTAAPDVVRFIDATKAAAAIVLAAPVYKGTYTGVLKAIVDLIPPDALVEKPALGISTAKLATHAIGVDQAYRALFGFFRARGQDTLFVSDDELPFAAGAGVLSVDAERRVRKAAQALVQSIGEAAAKAAPHP
jgi:FMN reductase